MRRRNDRRGYGSSLACAQRHTHPHRRLIGQRVDVAGRQRARRGQGQQLQQQDERGARHGAAVLSKSGDVDFRFSDALDATSCAWMLSHPDYGVQFEFDLSSSLTRLCVREE